MLEKRGNSAGLPAASGSWITKEEVSSGIWAGISAELVRFPCAGPSDGTGNVPRHGGCARMGCRYGYGTQTGRSRGIQEYAAGSPGFDGDRISGPDDVDGRKESGRICECPEKNESRPKGKRWLWMAAVDLFLCSLLIYGVKLLSDYGATSRKYDLLSSLGMKKRQRKKSIRTETSGDIWISLGLSFVIAGIYTICNYHVFSEHGRNLGEGFLIRWLIMAAGYLLLNGIAAEIYTRVLQKLLIREDISR